MRRNAARVDTSRNEREPNVKDAAAALWHFVRNDPVGRRLGIAWAVVAWFALTWLSLLMTAVLVLFTTAVLVAQRKRRGIVVEDDLDDLI
jgi:Flp pilus assembly protein TadB